MIGSKYRIFSIAAVAAAIGTAIITILNSGKAGREG